MELLVVVLIVGVLAAVAVPVYLNQRRKVNTAALKQDLRTVAQAVETWSVDNPSKAIPIPDATYLGWSILLYGSPEATLNGHPMSEMPANVFHSGFPTTKVSPQTAIGIVYWGGRPGDYCLVGNATSSQFTGWGHNALYYDATGGGILLNRDLPANGSCAPYRLP